MRCQLPCFVLALPVSFARRACNVFLCSWLQNELICCSPLEHTVFSIISAKRRCMAAFSAAKSCLIKQTTNCSHTGRMGLLSGYGSDESTSSVDRNVAKRHPVSTEEEAKRFGVLGPQPSQIAWKVPKLGKPRRKLGGVAAGRLH